VKKGRRFSPKPQKSAGQFLGPSVVSEAPAIKNNLGKGEKKCTKVIHWNLPAEHLP
jgi:hypothetical protein